MGLGYSAAVALRYALNPFPVGMVTDVAVRARIGRSVDMSLEQFLDWWATVRTFALDLGEEARSLAAHL